MKNISNIICLLTAVATAVWGYMSKGQYYALAIVVFWVLLFYLISIKLKLSGLIQTVVYLSIASIIAILSYSSQSEEQNINTNNNEASDISTETIENEKDSDYYNDLLQKYTIEKKAYDGTLKNGGENSYAADKQDESDLVLNDHLAAIEYTIISEISGEYQLTFKIKPKTNKSQDSEDVSVVVNGQNSFTLSIPSQSEEEWLWTEPANISLGEGKNLIEIVKISDSNTAVEIDELKLIPIIKEPS
ncbi:MAG: hypothetical protein BWY19_00626 [bacterium ADurb.Bin212]|nr:MAG: hypothetical protein BWY19_00626 [bacterium ADurb.Bin212]